MLRLGNQAGTSGLIFDDQTAATSTADIFGTGAVVAQSATVIGSGFRTVVDLGTPPDFMADISTVVGVGEIIHVGTGAVQAQQAVVVGTGAGVVNITGSGILAAALASVSGAGFLGIGGTGVLVSQNAVVVGSGALDGIIFGAGVLRSQDVSVSGAGVRDISGAGVLNAQVSSVFGIGLVINIAIDYVASFMPNTIALEVLSMTASYPEIFARNRKIPGSVTVGWDDLVTYHEGRHKDTHVAYQFSSGKDFLEDDD